MTLLKTRKTPNTDTFQAVIMIDIRYDNQDMNLRCSFNRKPLHYDFHTVIKPIP